MNSSGLEEGVGASFMPLNPCKVKNRSLDGASRASVRETLGPRCFREGSFQVWWPLRVACS